HENRHRLGAGAQPPRKPQAPPPRLRPPAGAASFYPCCSSEKWLHAVTRAPPAQNKAGRGSRTHMGGVMPSRPTETAAASSVPSSFLLAAAMKIFEPGLRSLLSPGT